MAERVRETAPGWRRFYGNQFLDFCQSFEDFRSLIRAELGMEAESEQAELQLLPEFRGFSLPDPGGTRHGGGKRTGRTPAGAE